MISWWNELELVLPFTVTGEMTDAEPSGRRGHSDRRSPAFHRKLASGGWRRMSLILQLANVGSEVIRSINWRHRHQEYSRLAAERALELLWLTIDDPKNRTRLGELVRLYEVTVDELYQFKTLKSDSKLENYFLPFNLAANSP